jgi:predicted Ser/Thr protein kinase
LVKLGEFDSDLWENRIIYCQKFNDSISDAYKKRGNKMMKKEELIQFLCDKGVVKAQKVSVNPQKVSVKPQSILKETKEKETKEKEIQASPFVYFPYDYILDLKYKEYLAFRKQIKKPLSEISIKANIESLKKLSKENNDVAVQILEQSIANGWQGLFELKQSKETQSPQSRLEKFTQGESRLEKFMGTNNLNLGI